MILALASPRRVLSTGKWHDFAVVEFDTPGPFIIFIFMLLKYSYFARAWMLSDIFVKFEDGGHQLHKCRICDTILYDHMNDQIKLSSSLYAF